MMPNNAEVRMWSAAIKQSQLSQLSLYYEESELLHTKLIADFEAMSRSCQTLQQTLASAKVLFSSHWWGQEEKRYG